MRPRPVLQETEGQTKTNYCETKTETETKKSGLETLTSLIIRHICTALTAEMLNLND